MKTPYKTSESPKKYYKSNPLHFQIALIISLLLVYIMLEMAFPIFAHKPSETASIPEDDITYVIDNYVVEKKDVPKEKKPQKKKTVLLTNPIISDDPDVKEIKQEILTTSEIPTDIPLDSITYIDDYHEPIEVPFPHVEFVPIFPGCESLSSNEERKTCMSEKIGKLIQKHFKTYLAEDYGLSGIQKIYTQFKIDTRGKVTDIKVRAPYPFLEKEARRVLQLIPQMQAGRQQDRAVEVIFMKPIIFELQ